MSKIKEILLIIAFAILNTFIAFFITNLLGIANTVVIKTVSVMYGDITWEVIIFFLLSLIESSIYEYFKRKK